jgi:hypothetical protein
MKFIAVLEYHTFDSVKPVWIFKSSSFMELGHLLTRSGLTCPEVSSKVCQSGSSMIFFNTQLSSTTHLHLSCLGCLFPVCSNTEILYA